MTHDEVFSFRIGRGFNLKNTTPELNRCFKVFYSILYGTDLYNHEGSWKIAFEIIKNGSIRYLKEIALRDSLEMADSYFENFTPVWDDLMKGNRYLEAKKYWYRILNIEKDLEDEIKNKIHKGTPFYFLGGTCILNDNINEGMILINKALIEDKKRGGRETPAELFIRIDDRVPNQYFSGLVLEIAKFIKRRIKRYNNKYDSSLKYRDFLKDFLHSSIVRTEIISYFTYAVLNLMSLRRIENTRSVYSPVSSPFFLHKIFSITLALDKYCKIYNSSSSSLSGHFNKFGDNKWKIKYSRAEASKMRKILDDKRKMNKLIINLLNGKQKINGKILNNEASDFFLAITLRNYSAHYIENISVISKRYWEISERLLNSFFFAFENRDLLKK